MHICIYLESGLEATVKQVVSREENAFLFYQVILVSQLSCLGDTIHSVLMGAHWLKHNFLALFSFRDYLGK